MNDEIKGHLAELKDRLNPRPANYVPETPFPPEEVTDVPVLEIEKPKEEAKALSPMLVDENGVVKAKDNSELLRYCGAMVKSGMVPDRFDKPEKLFGALMYVRSLGLSDASIRQVAIIHGTPSIFGDLPLALCQRTGEMEVFEELWFDHEYNEIKFENKNLDKEAYGAVCFIRRKGLTKQSFSFTLDDAKQAGVYPCSKPSMPWAKHTKLMLRFKARSIALKSVFADCISGVQIAEEHDVSIHEIDVTPQSRREEEKAIARQLVEGQHE